MLYAKVNKIEIRPGVVNASPCCFAFDTKKNNISHINIMSNEQPERVTSGGSDESHLTKSGEPDKRFKVGPIQKHTDDSVAY